MGELGIAYALLSVSSPSLWTKDPARTRTLARKVNDEGAEIVSRAPGNLGFLATLPLPEVSAAIDEARRCLDTLHAGGVGLMTNYGGVYLGDRSLDPILAELNGRGALAVLHPTKPAVTVPNVNQEIPVPAFEYFVETTRTFLNLVQNDTFARYPDIRWVIPHAGAFLPILADMAHVYYDLAGFSEPKQLAMLFRNVDETHLLYGSDTPYTDISACVGQAEALEETPKLTERQKALLFTENALTLLPDLKERML